MRKLLEKYKVKVVLKSKSSFMKMLGVLQEPFSRITADQFMKEYTTTIGSTIYAKRDFIRSMDDPDIDDMALLVHEMRHVLQFRDGSWLRYATPGGRALLEAQAVAEANRFRIAVGDEENKVDESEIRAKLYLYGIKGKDLTATVKYVLIKQQEPIKEGELVYDAIYAFTNGVKHA